MWRDIRHGKAGLSTAYRAEDGVLINANGSWWADLRKKSGLLIKSGAILLAAIIAILILYFALKGPLHIDKGRSGKTVSRFSLAQRVTHWVIACLFLYLALSGLTLLFGRPFILPLIGAKAYGVLASAVMQSHNLFGPIFTVSLIALFIAFVRGNFPNTTDIRWILKGGGLLGGHVSAGRYNAGEKVWFWVAVIAGVALSGSGVIMLFPDFMGVRNLLQLSELTHGIAALIFIAFAIGHIYLGTVGTEGALEGMTTGDVDENWARTHHDLWLDEINETRKEVTQ
jgi:formate dehydrogenase subunit gamma